MKNNFLIILIIGLIVSASSYSQKILHLENDLVSDADPIAGKKIQQCLWN